MLQEKQEHPLILELKNLKSAIAACPVSPEREYALHRADLAIRYAQSVIGLYEGHRDRLVNTALDVGKIPKKFSDIFKLPSFNKKK